MFYYKYNDNILISNDKLLNCPFSLYDMDYFCMVDEQKASTTKGIIYFLNSTLGNLDKNQYAISENMDVFIEKESIEMLKSKQVTLPNWIVNKISHGMAAVLNLNNSDSPELLNDSIVFNANKKWNIHISGLGDVGGTLTTGLRLLGGSSVASIGIYDKDAQKTKRWEYECGQILSPNATERYPEIKIINEDEIFNCDMFVFCVSLGVPAVGEEKKDVRLIQYDANSKVAAYYAKLARRQNFKGIFAVVSDPVDFLCKKVLLESNKDENGNTDRLGLKPEQIKGFGLGVMNARACYYAKKSLETIQYLKEGRAFGPHGEGLIIADSIDNYNELQSNYLTKKTKKANLEIRATGFKPYIAPALSSGSLSILDFINGKWHYSSNPIGGTYFGSRNRLTAAGIQIETYNFPKELYDKIYSTYSYLNKFNVD